MRSNILSALEQHIATQLHITAVRAVTHHVNTFPCFTIGDISETRQHEGDGTQFRSLTVLVRGYNYVSSIDDIDALGRALETTIAQFNSFPGLLNCRVTSFETDEGLLDPLGICELVVGIDYVA